MIIKAPDENLDVLKRIPTDKLYPKFLEQINILLNNLASRGLYFVATCGFRSPEEQDQVFQIGRTVGRLGHTISNAPPFSSYHQYGLAIDFAKQIGEWKGKLNPDYRDSQYKDLADEAIKVGLRSGYYWKYKDTPHCEYDFTKTGQNWRYFKELYIKGGLEEVWKFLDRF